jgi:hypothetical protein
VYLENEDAVFPFGSSDFSGLEFPALILSGTLGATLAGILADQTNTVHVVLEEANPGSTVPMVGTMGP